MADCFGLLGLLGLLGLVGWRSAEHKTAKQQAFISISVDKSGCKLWLNLYIKVKVR